MINRTVKKTKICLILAVSLLSSALPISPDAVAGSKIRLSATKKSYCLHGVWDKLTLKNVPSGVKINWKSTDTATDTKIVKIKERKRNLIWYKVIKNGSAKITARYKGKTYACRIKVDKTSPTGTPVQTSSPDPSSDHTDKVEETAAPDTKDISLNATDVTIYHCPSGCIPYVHDPSHPMEFKFNVIGTDIKPTWRLNFDSKPGLTLSKDGLLSFSDIYASDKTEATVTACFPGALNNLNTI